MFFFPKTRLNMLFSLKDDERADKIEKTKILTEG